MPEMKVGSNQQGISVMDTRWVGWVGRDRTEPSHLLTYRGGATSDRQGWWRGGISAQSCGGLMRNQSNPTCADKITRCPLFLTGVSGIYFYKYFLCLKINTHTILVPTNKI